jgi:hypothetical protein
MCSDRTRPREFNDEVQHWRILGSTTGYVDGVTGCVKQRPAKVLLQEQGRLLLVGLLQGLARLLARGQ